LFPIEINLNPDQGSQACQSFYFQFNQYLAMRPHVWTPCGLCQISRMPIVLLSIQPIFSNGSHVWTARMDALRTLSDLRCAPPIQNDFNPVILKNIEKALKDSCYFFAVFDVSEHPPLFSMSENESRGRSTCQFLIGPRGTSRSQL